jgi:hypothetical protein
MDRAAIAAIAADLRRAVEALDRLVGIGATRAPADRIQPAQFPARVEWIDTAKAAGRLKCSYSSLYRYARAGLIIGEVGSSGTWRFDAASVEAFKVRRAA